MMQMQTDAWEQPETTNDTFDQAPSYLRIFVMLCSRSGLRAEPRSGFRMWQSLGH